MKTDKEIIADVINELKWEPSLDAAHVGISVSGRVVTLTGYVPSNEQKWAAGKAAERVSGVMAIANELEVRLKTGSERTDAEIAKFVANTLMWHVSVPEGIKAAVAGGVVTLKGETEWNFQKVAAEVAVRSLEGVKGVNNEIFVKPKVQPVDIKKKIEDALQRTAAEKAEKINIKVDGRKVILEGKVHSSDEYWAAQTAAYAAPGVISVENRLQVS